MKRRHARAGITVFFTSSVLAASVVVPVWASVAGASTPGAPSSATVASAPSLPAGANILGQAADGQALHLDLVLKSRNPGSLAKAARDISTPGSPTHGRFLTVDQFASQFGQPAGVLAGVSRSLSGLGLGVGQPSANGLVIPISTTVGQAARSLGTAFVDERLSDGRIAYANSTPARLPASVGVVTQALLGLNNLPTPDLMSADASTSQTATTTGITACTAAKNKAKSAHGWTFPQLSSAYGLKSLYQNGQQGAGVNIALFELDPWSGSDISAFQKCYQTSAGVSTVKVDGGATTVMNPEAALDIETAIGIAPKAHITVYDAPNTNYATSTVDELTKIFNDDKSQMVSISYGLCESLVQSEAPGLMDSENTLFEQAATEGISVLAASGDTGSEGCMRPTSGSDTSLEVLDPASQPFVTAVGGTDLKAATTPPSESTWNDKTGSGGGGISNYWTMPSWQSAPGVENPYSNGMREVPDVSASASALNPYIIYYKGGWQADGGTSAAAPLWTAMLADIESIDVQPRRAGFLNPTLYAASSVGAAPAFNDVTSGTNDYKGLQGGSYPATAGYDLATGLGTPKAGAVAGYVYAETNSSIAFVDAPGTDAPPSRLGSYSVTAFDPSFCSDGATFSMITGPTGGLSLAPSAQCVYIGADWATWSNGYSGAAAWDDANPGGSNSMTLTLPAGVKAFYLYAEPDEFETFNLQATTQDGTTSGPLQVYGDSGAQYIGFYVQSGSATTIQSVTIACDDDFAIGEFGVAG